MKISAKKLAHSAGLAMLLLGAGAFGTGSFTIDSAYAKGGNNGGNGGNGGGNGNGNAGGNNGNAGNGNSGSNRGNGNARASTRSTGTTTTGNGRGYLARELKGLNAAHANINALKNAAPGSMPGKLYAYQTSYQSAAGAQTAVTAAEAELTRLENLSAAEIAAEFPNGGHTAAITTAEQTLAGAQTTFATASTTLNMSYTTLTGGRALSTGALAELNRLLGL